VNSAQNEGGKDTYGKTGTAFEGYSFKRWGKNKFVQIGDKKWGGKLVGKRGSSIRKPKRFVCIRGKKAQFWEIQSLLWPMRFLGAITAREKFLLSFFPWSVGTWGGVQEWTRSP